MRAIVDCVACGRDKAGRVRKYCAAAHMRCMHRPSTPIEERGRRRPLGLAWNLRFIKFTIAGREAFDAPSILRRAPDVWRSA
jgi:hypothetical protein